MASAKPRTALRPMPPTTPSTNRRPLKELRSFVSAGDQGAAGCDPDASNATHGIGVNGFASTPYNVAVGGTDFADSYAGTNSSYWNTANASTFGSAQSYIPEIPWNDSCANDLMATYFGFNSGYSMAGYGMAGYENDGFCNTATGRAYYLTTSATSGGPSGCATGFPLKAGEVSGTCAGYAKPSWQAGVLGLPNDQVRDLPDVSLFAANGIWGHYYVYCWSDTDNGGAACTGAPSNWSGGGGTSFSSPIMAGIQALVNQNAGSAQGNPNYIYYQLAATEYGLSGIASCNSTNGSSAACTFNDVTLGDIVVNCTGTANCYGGTTASSVPIFGERVSRVAPVYGGLSNATAPNHGAYEAGAGWDFATGIGTINAYNLVMNWPK